MRLNNPKGLKGHRRNLRENLTPAETVLWNALQRSRIEGRKFRRQHSVGPYILDFSCPAQKLAVELGGAAHDFERAQVRDEERDRYLAEFGIRMLRFQNQDVMRNLEGVLQKIRGRFRG